MYRRRQFRQHTGIQLSLPFRLPWHDPDGGLFTLRLARLGIAAPLHQRIDLSLTGKLRIPVHGREYFPLPLSIVDTYFCHHHSTRRTDPCQLPVAKGETRGICSADLNAGLRDMLHQPGNISRTGHGMPLIADASGIQQQRI